MTGLSAIHATNFGHVVVLLQQHLAKCDSINSFWDIPGVPSALLIHQYQQQQQHSPPL